MTTATTARTIDLNALLREQLTHHWDGQVRPRLEGLTDAEYLWEPVDDAWNVHPGTDADHPTTIDFTFPEPDPPPVTTIAWRLAHVVVGILAMRNAAHFGREATDYQSFPYAATAAGALAQLDEEYAGWLAGVESLGEEGLQRAVGEAEGEHAEASYATLVLHINREVIHHLAEVCLLRDLYARYQEETAR
ncbi:DinB family protein [Nocardioides sp.]|uniref:DinB family protein n=1 Tax=Nocardioides sp. TaxID=35761 RepID=UPI00271B81B7|nr:DinB family protein [Nocardioides sp.]MDO9455831.1 DinB family protein [Nocardioides sp.]